MNYCIQHDGTTEPFTAKTGPLGNYYQPTNSPLINAGSESVDDAGLTGYTILTNQSPDTGTVDIGYHYATISPPVVYDDPYEQSCPNDPHDFYLGYDGYGYYAYDPNGLPLTFIVVTQPAHGTLNYGSIPGEFIYTPNSCYEGVDSFTFKVTDGVLDSTNTATVTLTTGDTVSTYYSPSPAQTCKNTPLSITLGGHDSCGEDSSTFTYTVLANPTNGVLTGTGANLTYTPTNATFTGMDHFTYKVSTVCGDSATNTMTITVGDANISANPQTAMTGTNQPVNLTLTASDYYDSCFAGSFTCTITTNPPNGTLSGTGTNRTYTPHTNYEGIDHFTFNVSDGVWTSSAPATVTIFVVAGPTNLTAQCPTNGVGILLNWSLDNKVQEMVANDGLTIAGFEIYRLTAPGLFSTNDIIYTTSDSSQTNYVDLVATQGDTYYYVVTLSYQDPDTGIIYLSPYSKEATNTTCCPAESGDALWVEYGPTPQQLAQWIMGTNHVTVTNATYTGNSIARGIFGNGNACGLPIDTGVILASGDITNAIGPNNNDSATTVLGADGNGDADLNRIISPYTSATTEDASILKFDAIFSTNLITFQYIFASEEYPEFVGSFDDVCAIFVDETNIALVSGTLDPVSVYTVNGANNPQYFFENYYGDSPQPFNIQYNGLTTNFTAQVLVSTNTMHHIKIAVADTGDHVLDSAILIKAQISCP